MAVKKVGLIDAAEVSIEMGNARMIRTFEIEGHAAAGPFPDEQVEQKVIGFGWPPGG